MPRARGSQIARHCAAGAHPELRPLVLTRHGLWRSLVSASVWGTEGREFKSPQPDRQEPWSALSSQVLHRAYGPRSNSRYLDI